MATPVYYSLADVDGTLCIAAKSADFNEPKYVTVHWPTKLTVTEFCRWHEIERGEISMFEVFQEIPGTYRARHKTLTMMPSTSLDLLEGARTKSILATVSEPLKKPRHGKGSRCEWDGGRWRIVPPMGKPRIVTV